MSDFYPPSNPLANNPYLTRYLQLYTLHQVEHTASSVTILRVRVAAVRYLLRDMPHELNAYWQVDPLSGVAAVRDWMKPRFTELRDEQRAWELLGLDGADATWQPYVALRQNANDALRAVVPVVENASKRAIIPAEKPGERIARRLDQTQRLLEYANMALQLAENARRLWQNWQIGREEQRLLQAKRLYLEDAIRVTNEGQNRALDEALNPSNVSGYLMANNDDDMYDLLFGENDDEIGKE